MEENPGTQAVITVLGKDRVGIIAEVCTYLSKREINILDISQTIRQGFFNMLMIVEMPHADSDAFSAAASGLEALGETMGLEIRLRHADIFNAMHRI
ncbi:MAG: ACT domain-containing protein [Oscillospiraceae bacterium]|jgi:ACT domain-containing protein|nr:ACT domain-containing protein [Oscillospiraceae bacterium]